MKKLFGIFMFVFVLMSNSVSGVEFIKQSDKISDFIPKGWKLIKQVEGDLNKDKIQDAVLIIEDTNPKHIKKESNPPFDDFDVIPQAILILFKEENGNYKLVSYNNKSFLGWGNAYSEKLDIEYNAVEIKNNTLKLYFYHEAIRSGSHSTYIFRWQNNSFQLIGFEHSIGGFFGAGTKSEDISSSVNLLTNKMIKTTSFEATDYGNPEKILEQKKESIEKDVGFLKKYTLDELEEDAAYKILEIIDNHLF